MTNEAAAGDGQDNGSLVVRLLGPVGATWSDGQAINLGGPMPKIAFVRLALDAGQTVSTEALIDTLWGEDPPRTARRSLQAHIAKLRHALGADDGPLSSQASGYTLSVPRSSVDVLRIEDLLRTAREVVDTDPIRASELVGGCRKDWAGAPLADLAGHDTLTAERERLARLNDEVGDLELEVNIALGNPAASIGDLERAVTREPTRETHWMRLIRAYYACGRQSEALDAYKRAADAMLERLGLTPSPQLQRLELLVLQQELAEEPKSECPYKGLASYQLHDGENFFGRTETINELINLVANAAVSVVVGPSGVGKSSVLRAGLAHRVVTGQVPGMKTVAVMTPGLNPLRALYASDSKADLLIVDQFEELFVLTDDPVRHQEFVDELLAVARSSQTHVVISVRADFYSQCLLVPSLSSILGRYQINIGAMSKAELQEAIERPAINAGLEVEPALVATLIDDVAGRPGSLPLLSHALSETWRHRFGTHMSLGSYEKSGRISGAISATAERVFESLDSDGRVEIEQLFGRLVGVGSSIADTRRVVPRSEIDSSGFSPDLVDRLVAVRLLTATADQVEIAHEAMISSWPRLVGWLDSERDHLITHQRLNRAANAWDDGGRDDGELYSGNRLDVTLTWRNATEASLSKLEVDFLVASERKEKHSQSADRRAKLRGRTLIALASLAVVVAGSAAWLALGRGRDAEESRGVVDAIQLASGIAEDESLTTANRLRVAAGLQSQTASSETSSLLLDAVLHSPAAVSVSQVDIVDITGSAPLGTSGGVLSVAVADDGWSLLDGSTLELTRPSLDFTPRTVVQTDGRLLVVGDNHQVFDAATGEPVGPPAITTHEPEAEALSQDGTLIAFGYGGTGPFTDPGSIEIFDVQTGSLTHTFELSRAQEIRKLEISADGSLIAVVGVDQFSIWDIELGDERFVPDSPFTSVITATGFDESGSSFVVGHTDGTVEIWRWVTEPIRQDRGTVVTFSEPTFLRLNRDRLHQSAVSWVDIASDDGLIATSAVDGSVVLWNAMHGSHVSGPVMFESTGKVASFFDAATGELVTVDSRGTVWQWDARAQGGLLSVAEVEADDVLVATAADRTVLVDDVARIVVLDGAGETIHEMLDIRLRFDPIWNLSINDAGSDLVYSTRDGVLRWLSLETFEEVELLPEALGHDGQFVSATQVVAVGTKGLQLIDLASPENATARPFGVGPVIVAYDAELGLAATVTESDLCFCPREVTLWDLATGQQVGPRFAPLLGGSIRSLRFEGSTLVARRAERSGTLSVDPEIWRGQACDLAESLDPAGDLPPDPRLEDIRECP